MPPTAAETSVATVVVGRPVRPIRWPICAPGPPHCGVSVAPCRPLSCAASLRRFSRVRRGAHAVTCRPLESKLPCKLPHSPCHPRGGRRSRRAGVGARPGRPVWRGPFLCPASPALARPRPTPAAARAHPPRRCRAAGTASTCCASAPLHRVRAGRGCPRRLRCSLPARQGAPRQHATPAPYHQPILPHLSLSCDARHPATLRSSAVRHYWYPAGASVLSCPAAPYP
jgi:hypothetical protein